MLHRRPSIALAPLVLLLSSSVAEATSTIQLRDGQPKYSETVEVTAKAVHVSDSPFTSCPSSRFVAREPIAVVEVPREQTFQVGIRGADGRADPMLGFALRRPDGKYHCENDNDPSLSGRWPAGRYELYAVKGWGDVKKGATVTVRARVFVTTTERPEPTTMLELPDATTNPTRKAAQRYTGAFVGPSFYGIECRDRNGHPNPFSSMTAAPVARLALERNTHLTFMMANVKTRGFLIQQNGRTWCRLADGKSSDFNITLDAGQYDIHAVVDEEALPPTRLFDLLLFDQRISRQHLASTPRRSIGRLAEPLFVDVELQENRPVLGGGFCPSRGPMFPVEPDLVIETQRPLPSLEIAFSGPVPKDTQLRVDTPKTKTTFSGTRRCSNADDKFFERVADGTYAVYIGRAQKSPAKVRLMITERDTVLDPFRVPTAPPATVPLAERAVPRWMPLLDPSVLSWDLAAQLELWEQVPTPLVAYARGDFDDVVASPTDSAKNDEQRKKFRVRYPKAGEPLLILAAGDEHFNVIASDLSRWRVRRNMVDEDASPLVVPQSVGQWPPVDFQELWTVRTKKVRRLSDRVDQLQAKASDCYQRYWERHHGGTYGVELLEVTEINGRVVRVESYSDKVDRRAYRKCGFAKIDRLHAKLKKTARRAYEKKRKALLVELRRRLSGATAMNAR